MTATAVVVRVVGCIALVGLLVSMERKKDREGIRERELERWS
jgi:hypothetical protein